MSSPLRIAIDEEGPATAPTPHAQLVSLLAAEVSLAGTLTALVRWWSSQLGKRRVVVGVRDAIWPGLHLVEAGPDRIAKATWVEDCLLTPDSPLRAVVSQAAQFSRDSQWLPLTWEGQEFGGLLCSGPASPPDGTEFAEALSLSACLVFAARAREQRLREAKLSALAEFAAGAGHEVNNPLGSILGRVQLLSRDEASAERRRQLATIGAQALRVRDMIGDAMLFARPPAATPGPQSIAVAIGEVAQQFAAVAAERKVRLEISGDADDVWQADPAQLRIVLSELVRNSLVAAPANSTVRLQWRCETRGDRRTGVLEVTDAGPGLTPEDAEHLFDPFYSGRQAGRGLGFGLSKCWRIVIGHGGCLHVRNRDPGVQLAMHWPLVRATRDGVSE